VILPPSVRTWQEATSSDRCLKGRWPRPGSRRIATSDGASMPMRPHGFTRSRRRREQPAVPGAAGHASRRRPGRFLLLFGGLSFMGTTGSAEPSGRWALNRTHRGKGRPTQRRCGPVEVVFAATASRRGKDRLERSVPPWLLRRRPVTEDARGGTCSSLSISRQASTRVAAVKPGAGSARPPGGGPVRARPCWRRAWTGRGPHRGRSAPRPSSGPCCRS
jgi:hypothetical protein